MENIPRIRTRVNRVMKKFMQKYPDLDLSINNWEFFNPDTKKLFEVFEAGYMSCPSYQQRPNYIIGRLDETGLKIEKMPHTHRSYAKAITESQRLAYKNEALYIVFTTGDPAFDVWATAKIAKQKTHRASTGDIRFTVYWKHGERSVITGKSIEEAFGRAGYGAGALAAVDWYDNTDVATHTWDDVAKKWSRINPFDFKESKSHD